MPLLQSPSRAPHYVPSVGIVYAQRSPLLSRRDDGVVLVRRDDETHPLWRVSGRILGHVLWALPLGAAAWLTMTPAWPGTVVIILAYCHALAKEQTK